jgi:hypothetical protein
VSFFRQIRDAYASRTSWRGFRANPHRSATDARKEGRFFRPSFSAYAKGDGQPAGSPVEIRDAFTVHPPS